MTSEEMKAKAEKRVREIADAIGWSGDMRVNMTTVVGALRCAVKMLDEERAARLAADEQLEREDAEPITGHVIASLMPKEQFGEALYTIASFALSSEVRLSIGGVVGDDGGFSVAIHGTPAITTRGQLRKLLEALKGGAS